MVSIRSRFIQLLVIWPETTHWPTHPPTHPWVGVSLQIINLQTGLNYLDSVNIFQIFSDLTWPHQSTHPTTHPPTKLHTHPWVGNSSQISNLQTELKYLDKLKCYRILSDSGGPSPWGVADGWMGVGVGMGVWGCVPCTRTCTHAHTCMLNMLNMDASMLEAICNSIHVCVCVCMCARACGDTPHAPRHPPTHLPPPQSHREPKTPNFNNSWTNQDNSILFEDSLPLNIPELI